MTWPQLMKVWNEMHPEHPYRHARNMERDYKHASTLHVVQADSDDN